MRDANSATAETTSTAFEAHKFDREVVAVVVVVEMQVAFRGGRKFFISDSHTTLCKGNIRAPR